MLSWMRLLWRRGGFEMKEQSLTKSMHSKFAMKLFRRIYSNQFVLLFHEKNTSLQVSRILFTCSHPLPLVTHFPKTLWLRHPGALNPTPPSHSLPPNPPLAPLFRQLHDRGPLSLRVNTCKEGWESGEKIQPLHFLHISSTTTNSTANFCFLLHNILLSTQKPSN